MKAKRISIVLLVLFFSFAVLVTTSSAAAIFTSRGDGTGVNINLFDDKCAVFLNGGPPPHGDCSSSGLPDGCYVFQVTAPPGGGPNETLLSQDSIKKRFFKVSEGVIVYDDGSCAAAAATLTDCETPTVDYDDCGDTCDTCFVNNTGSGEKGHDAGVGKCGNISVRLMPYDDTPNPGGVYKVYATRVEDYTCKVEDCTCSESVFGFIHDNSKTDNFRVKPSGPPPPQQGEIDVLKFCDANANGFLDPAELTFGLSGWQISITPDGCNGLTDVNGVLSCPDLNTGTYSVAETVEPNFAHTATCVDGFCGYCSVTTTTPCNVNGDCPSTETCVPNPVNPASITIIGEDFHNADFGNVGLSEITGRKFNDTNTNGSDDNEPGIAGVKVLLSGTAANGTPVNQCAVSGADGSYSFSNLLPGIYMVSEVKPAETVATTPTSCEKELTVDTEQDAEGIITCEGKTEICSFGNVCLGAGGGLTLGFWSNKNGQALFGSDDLALMVSLNLRNANGNHFNPTSYSQFRTWLLNATATNMAYMLSAQLAAMELNVLNGKVNGNALIYAPGTTSANALGFATVNAVMAEANTELGLHGLTLAGSPYRTYQEALKNALDAANNNKNFVVPCPSFGMTC